MNQQIFAVYDVKAEAYLQPFYLPNEGMAVRVFADCCKDKNHNFGQHPEDYHLVHVGTWNQYKGTITALDAPRTITTGTATLRKETTE